MTQRTLTLPKSGAPPQIANAASGLVDGEPSTGPRPSTRRKQAIGGIARYLLSTVYRLLTLNAVQNSTLTTSEGVRPVGIHCFRGAGIDALPG